MCSVGCYSPTDGDDQRAEEHPDPSVLMGEAHEHVSALRARLYRMVQQRSNLIVELFDKVPQEFTLFPNIKANFKLAIAGAEPPLKLNFSYSDQAMRSILVYWHYTVSEPTAEASIGHQHNPKQIVITSTYVNRKTGLKAFEAPFIYFSIQPATAAVVKVTPQFRKGTVVKPKTSAKAALLQLISEKGKKGGFTVEDLDGCLKGGTLQEKRQKVQLFVDSVVND